jgi:hypothetical protein
MRKLALLVVLTGALVVAALFAGTASASVAYPYNYCWGYEWGTVKQSSTTGNWYRCAFTGQGATGFQWWGLW